MLRQIIKIDEEKCNGCGLCVSACHEGAIGLVDGKAKLIREDYCDGLGNCLPACPTGAITFEEREAAGFNEAEVKRNAEAGAAAQSTAHSAAEAAKAAESAKATEEATPLPCGCPGTHAAAIQREAKPVTKGDARQGDARQGDATQAKQEDATQARQGVGSSASSTPQDSAGLAATPSQLMQWPVQIKLVPVNEAYFNNANLLVAADCTAYAHGNFHNEFMRNKITLIGCPKLDEGDYSEKLTAILMSNNIKSVTVVRMEVPCCGGIENAVKTALRDCGKMIPWQSVIIGTDGEIID